MDFNTLIFDGDVNWQLEDGGYYALFDIENEITPFDNLSIVFNGNKYYGSYNFSYGSYVFYDGAEPVIELAVDEGSTYNIMVVPIPTSDHITITAVEREDLNTFYQGTVNCDTQSGGDVPLWYGSFTANYSPTNQFIYGEVDGVKAGGTFTGSTLQLNDYLTISHTGGYNYTLLNYRTAGPVTLNLKCIDIS